MSFIKIKNKSGHDVSFLSEAGKKLKPYISLVSAKHYPLKVLITEKKHIKDRSNFDLNYNFLHLKYNPRLQQAKDFEWVFLHEFAHFICNNNPELRKTCLADQYQIVETIFRKLGMTDEEITETAHDALAPEITANFFATMLCNKFYKRHSFKGIEKFLNKIGQR